MLKEFFEKRDIRKMYGLPAGMKLEKMGSVDDKDNGISSNYYKTPDGRIYGLVDCKDRVNFRNREKEETKLTGKKGKEWG